MAGVEYGSLPFEEAIQFFRRKLNLSTESWTDIWESDHDVAFVVAGANRDDLVADFRAAVDAAISKGETLEQFRKRFDDIVAKRGWSYHGSRNWRSRVIYETNLRTAYAAGRYQQLQAVKKERPYWEFHHTPVAHPRIIHMEHPPAGWNGLTLHADDPWWDTHYPPCGWGCQCVIYSRSAAQVNARGGPDEAPPIEYETKTVGANGPTPRTVETPVGVDPGFGYIHGKRYTELYGLAPPEEAADELAEAAADMPHAADELPPAREIDADRIMAAGLPAEDYVQAFLDQFNGSGAYRDVLDEYLIISDGLFRQGNGRLKVLKRGRERFVLLYADTIKQPDEIWLAWALTPSGGLTLRRRYIANWLEGDQAIPALGVFEYSADGWLGVTAFGPDRVQNLERRARVGRRLYRRDDGQ